VSVCLSTLLDGTGIVVDSGVGAVAVSGLSYDSRRTEPGDLFFALPGVRSDGSAFVRDAVGRGAVAVVTQSGGGEWTVPRLNTGDARNAMGLIGAAFYGRPSGSLKVIGITGTNGKTTTAFLCKHILDASQKRCGLIGTVKYVIGETEIEAPRTTPESVDLQSLLADMRDAGCKAVAMEVSSHAVSQKRTAGVAFDVAAFTNLTQDHLDYHGSMDAYFEAKAGLFDNLLQGGKKAKAVINADDRYGHLLVERIGKKLPVLTFGRGVRADFRATDVNFDASGSTFHLEARGRSYLVRLPLIGSFNIYNALAALAATAAMGTEVRAAVAALANAPQVPGRLERVPAKRQFQVFVDYAHTEDALRNVLVTLRALRPARLIVVVGCGGDRDRSKRPLMAAAASELADLAIFTSDNPRSELPSAILNDMRAGVRAGRRFEEIPEREAAIRHAVEIAAARDIIVIAGKGHENYQEAGGVRTPFDDVKIARRAIEARRVELEEED